MAKRKPATQSKRAGRARAAAPPSGAGKATSRRAEPKASVVSRGARKRTSGQGDRTRKAAGRPENGPALPSSLDLDQRPSAARSGRAEFEELRREHHETGPALTAGDVDADWVAAYSVGDEAPGGDNPTPGQAMVDDVGKALGVEYSAEEELEAVEKIDSRDRHRWELDPASSEDYPVRTRGGTGKKRKVRQ